MEFTEIVQPHYPLYTTSVNNIVLFIYFVEVRDREDKITKREKYFTLNDKNIEGFKPIRVILNENLTLEECKELALLKLKAYINSRLNVLGEQQTTLVSQINLYANALNFLD